MTDYLRPEERRITIRLLSYWEKMRASRPMPTEEDVDPADIADLWEYCFMIHTKDIGKEGYNFTYLGKAIQELYFEGLEKQDENSHIFPELEKLAHGYKEVIAKRTPLVTEGEITTPQGDTFKYRQVLLPLGKGQEVQAVFGGMRFLRVVSYG